MNDSLLKLRKEYSRAVLDEVHAHSEPIEQFRGWFGEAVEVKILEPNAMMLATVNDHGQPAARIVLIRDILTDGIGFFTNYSSRKGKELKTNSLAAATFFWPELERQVRLEGSIYKMSREASEAYFAQRPRGSQIGAWSSPQSEVIHARHELELSEELYTKKFEGQEVPCPPHWGGYILKIHYAEFWQGRENRLHDRVCYSLNKQGEWDRFRIAP